MLTLDKMSKMWAYKGFKNILKATIYLVLLVAFIKFYFILELFEYLKDNTSFTTSYVKEDKFILPSFVICIPGIKAEAQEKYGYHSIQSIINDPEGNFEKYSLG